MNKIKKVTKLLIDIKKIVRKEFSGNSSLGILSFLKSIPYGFLSISTNLYDLKTNNKDNFLSDWNRLHGASRINDRRKIVLDDKLIFHQMNEDNPQVKPILALTRNKKLYIKEEKRLIQITNKQQFHHFIKSFKYGLIIKPYTGGGGARISKVILREDQLHFEGSISSYQDFVEFVIRQKTDYFMTEIINQTGYAKKIYPKTLNTIRMLTMMDKDSGLPFIAAAVQRVGTDKSVVVDNFTAGGISIKINIEDGILAKGACHTNDGEIIWYNKHPDTGVEFFGMEIKQWKYIKNYILSFSEKYFYLPYIGWDVVPMEEGFFILEGNSNSDVNLLQIHEGLLNSERIKKFYKDNGVL